MKKVIFLIDGFNLYHSIRNLQEKAGYKAKWLDVFSLCKSYLHLFGKDAELEKVIFFSAIPHYLNPHNPKKVLRHQDYMECLKSTGVEVVLGRFKNKDMYCNHCKTVILKHEEKETDVAIAVKIFEICHTQTADIITVISGDTDIAPAVRTCQALFPGIEIRFAFPFARKNKELAQLAPQSFSINKNQYVKHLLPPQVTTSKGAISKPVAW